MRIRHFRGRIVDSDSATRQSWFLNRSSKQKATTEMYSTPNGAQEQVEEGEASGGESGDGGEEWESDGEGEGDDDDDSSEEEKEEVKPPRSERRSKLTHDPARERGKAIVPIGQSSKRPRTSSPAPTEKAPKHPRATLYKPPKALPKMRMTVPTISGAATSEIFAKDDDQEMEDAVTSNPDEVPLIARRNRRAPAGKTPQTTPAPEAAVREGGDATRVSVTFAEPLTSVRPSTSTANSPSLFATHHIPEDQVGAAKEAIRQAGIMMEQVKVVREASQAAYDASSTLQSNVQKSCELVARYTELENKQIQLDLALRLAQENLQKARDEAKDKMEEALKKKDQDLAEAQKEALNRTKLAEEKLASVGTLEKENSRLKAALDVANQEVSRLKNGNISLNDKASELAGKRNDLEAYLGGLAKKLFVMLEEFCQNFKEETSRVETDLDPINSPVKDEAAMNVLRLESRVAGVVDYLARLKVAMLQIDTSLWPRTTLQNDLESLMTRLNEVPDRVAEWKKSSARCGANVALSLVRVHCKEAREEKLAAIQVANTRKHNFQDFMENFIAAATRIADGIDLDEFVAPSSPPPEE
ncbi:hypothetical protein VPH35_044685 [Triticum aestivum]